MVERELEPFTTGDSSPVIQISIQRKEKRFASISKDGVLRLWIKDSRNPGGWKQNGDITKFEGLPKNAAFSRIDWADPQFGNILALVSNTSDRLRVYREI